MQCTVLSQHISWADGILVMVTGVMSLTDGFPQRFVQTFFLAPQQNGFFVLNSCLRFLINGAESKTPVSTAPPVSAPAKAPAMHVAESNEQQEAEDVVEVAVEEDAQEEYQEESVNAESVQEESLGAPAEAQPASEASAAVPPAPVPVAASSTAKNPLPSAWSGPKTFATVVAFGNPSTEVLVPKKKPAPVAAAATQGDDASTTKNSERKERFYSLFVTPITDDSQKNELPKIFKVRFFVR
jgi:hypothetical protein